MLTSAAIYMGAALAGLLVAVFGIDFLLAPARTLKITLFHPYRRDPWPQGVQEEDTVRFDFTGPRPPAPPIVPTWDEIVATSSARGATAEPASPGPSEASIEETTRESVVVEPLHVEVHRAPH